MYDVDCSYESEEDRMERLKKKVDELKKLEMTKYIEDLQNKTYPPNDYTYAE